MTSKLHHEYHDELKQAYDFFDRDGGGISRDELANAMKQFGKEMDEDALD